MKLPEAPQKIRVEHIIFILLFSAITVMVVKNVHNGYVFFSNRPVELSIIIFFAVANPVVILLYIKEELAFSRWYFLILNGFELGLAFLAIGFSLVTGDQNIEHEVETIKILSCCFISISTIGTFIVAHALIDALPKKPSKKTVRRKRPSTDNKVKKKQASYDEPNE